MDPAHPPAETVQATVPADWLPRFTGCQIWVHGDWADLADVWIEDNPNRPQDKCSWVSRRAHVLIDDVSDVCNLAQLTYIRPVPRGQCTWHKLSGAAAAGMWDWIAPDTPPPALTIHPQGWTPTTGWKEKPPTLKPPADPAQLAFALF